MALKAKKISDVSIFLLRCVFSVSLLNSITLCEIPNFFVDIELKPILYSDGKTLAEIIFDESGIMKHCRLHELEEDADAEPIIKVSGLAVKYPTFKEMLLLINSCTQLEIPNINDTDSTTTTTTTESPGLIIGTWSIWNGIAPGTKWCGVGDIAGSFEDLGSETDVDACCRAHDHCPVKLKAFRTGYGLLNLSLYTKSHCDCDNEFYSCLKNTRNKFADMVGNFYFNFMQVQCLKETRPFICVENRTEIDGGQQCVKWSADPSSTKLHVTVSQLEY
ncbi:uncharacterized protein [Parasteatoda tepidariorum]|uniref:uncharacterized protein n=1 Tax=Parasteatoda tepidariorum TaxID=114398 RepID=UPI001C71808A|nr:uncharacterized protein LOC107441666 [Parasteatoda tepidariorum]